MPLPDGTRIGSYEVIAFLDAGGMGEVYRARDTRLKRDVALKVLPQAFAIDPGRMLRFQREAELLASLNHPNIAAVYGVEDAALVMELVEGETLPCPLPIETAIGYAKQIAEALEFAHDRGVIHRDLKPANIKVTPDGTVKLLDFGLAKAIEDPSGIASDQSNSPTLTVAATGMGVILGTAAYMAPEQASGKTADRRADIWSFGAVLYEMLSGTKAFTGDSASDTLASVLKLEPDWNALPKGTPDSIRTLVRRCLTKDRKQRLQSIGEARIVLQQPANTIEVTASAKTRLNWLPWIAAAIFGGLAAWGWLKATPPEPKLVTRFSFSIPAAPSPGAIAVSPDGSRLAFVPGQGRPIYLRELNQLESKALPGTEGAYPPSFSPDGQWLAYRTSATPSQLKKISVAGGAALTLVSAIDTSGVVLVNWGADGFIYFVDRGLMRLPASGGVPSKVDSFDPAKGVFSHAARQLLPGGKYELFNAIDSRGSDGVPLFVADVVTGERKPLLDASGYASYVSACKGLGYLVYPRNGSLFAASFDPERLIVGSPVPVLEGVWGIGPIASFGVSDSGTLAYVPGANDQTFLATKLSVLDRGGRGSELKALPKLYTAGRFSPDGSRIVFAVLDLQRLDSSLWVFDLARTTMTRVTFEGVSGTPVWTPDGKRLVYAHTRNLGAPESELRIVPVDNSATPTTLLKGDARIYFPTTISPDGKTLIGFRNSTNANGVPTGTAANEIWHMPLGGGAIGETKPMVFIQSPFTKDSPQFSPDGKWVAYQADDSGRNEIYVVPYPGPGGKSQVSTDGGTMPRWSHDGRELFYRSGDKTMRVDVRLGAAFQAGAPTALFEQRANSFDPAPDAKRFLFLSSETPASQASEMRVVLNWVEELKQKVPAIK